MASGFDIYSLGAHGKFGVHVGIPINFGYESVEDIDKSKILVSKTFSLLVYFLCYNITLLLPLIKI